MFPHLWFTLTYVKAGSHTVGLGRFPATLPRANGFPPSKNGNQRASERVKRTKGDDRARKEAEVTLMPV